MKHDVVNLEKKSVGSVDLPDAIFGTEVNMSLIHETVKAVLANKRVGTASTKTRGEVKCSNVKPYRQKGTGRARHGTYASPLFVGGGITFGPKPRDYSVRLPKKKRHAALKSVLAVKVKENKLVVIDKWVPKKKTKEMAEIFKTMGMKSVLIVLDKPEEWLERTTRNIPYIDVAYANRLDTHNIIAHDFLMCEKGVLARLEEGLKQ